MPEAVVQVAEVSATKTRNGNTRFVLRAEDGKEYTTFREEIARQALAAEGKRARVEFHEQQRGAFTNVYLDSVQVLDGDGHGDGAAGSDDHAVDEVAWKTAVDAAPWLLGTKPAKPVEPDELFERLQPFKDLVAEDIREDGEEA
jgi:hypothetical protein